MLITDSRVRLLQEVVQCISTRCDLCMGKDISPTPFMSILIFSKETLYGHKIDELRRVELKKVRTVA